MRSLLVLLVANLLPAIAQAAGPTCALLDPEKTPRVALLEAKLLADPAATWVERASIDKVLQEQKLQAMFSPQGVGERVKLGKLLKADVLVMVRPVKDSQEPTLEVVVSETAGGLRLLVRAVPVTKDASADVVALLTAAKDGIKKHAEKITEVVAVPPFVSNDLEYTHDHLKGAFAKLAEAEALDRKGVVVVELAEAVALAKEIALTAPGATLDRPLPVYLLGEYRHEGKSKDATVAVKLRAERGGKPIGKPETVTLKPDAAPGTVRKWAAAILDTLAKDDKPRPPTDPKAEGKQLAERGRLFKRLGNWPEAVALFEAGLLLDPDQHDVRVDVLKTLGPPIRSAQYRSTFGKDLAGTELYLRLYLRGLDHLEAFVTRGGDVTKYRKPDGGLDLVSAFSTEAYYLRITTYVTPQQRELIQDAQKVEKAVFLRLIPKVYHLDQHDHMPFVYVIVQNLSDPDKLTMLDQLIRDLPDTPRSVLVAPWYAEAGVYYSNKPGEEIAFQAFREKLAAGRTAAYKAAAAEIPIRLKFLEDRKKALLASVPPGRTDTPRKPDGVKLTYVELQLDGPTPKPFPVHLPTHRLMGILRLGPSTDFVWSVAACYLMKEKGKLRPVPGLAGLFGPHAHVRFDGKYVWLSNGQVSQVPFLYVVDPETEQIWDVTTAAGIPRPTTDQMKGQLSEPYPLAPLGPGRVCLAGRIGNRTWVGVAEFERSTGKATVNVVAEAREADDPLNKEQWASPDLAFTPSYIHPLAGPGGAPATRVLVGRMLLGSSKSPFHALVVDPTGVAKPEVLREPMGRYSRRSLSFDRCGEAGGWMYFLETTSNPTNRLRRIQMPGPVVETIADGLPSATQMVLPDGDRWHAVEVYQLPPPKPGEPPPKKFTKYDSQARNWWTVEPGAKQAQLVGTDLPPIQAIASSAHYGLVAIAVRDPDNQSVLHSVEIAKPTQPVPVVAPHVPKKHPDEEKGIKSLKSDTPTTIGFSNESGQTIRIYWIGFDGTRKLYATLEAGQKFEQKTFLTHVWLVTDRFDDAWYVFQPEAKPRTFEIEAPKK